MPNYIDIQDTLSFYQFDSALGFWGVPNVRREIRYTLASNAIFEVRHNSFGNRDDEPQPSPSETRALILGGSNTWGAGLEQNRRYTDILEKQFGIETINCGHCSLGLDQVCLYLLTKGSEFRPKTVIIEQHPWALHRVINNFVSGYVKPTFYIEDDRIRLRRLSRWYKYRTYRNLVGAYFKFRKEYREYQAGVNVARHYDHNSDIIFEDPIFLKWKEEYYTGMYEVVCQLIKIIKDECNRLGASLIFLLPPTKPELKSQVHSSLVDYRLPRDKIIEFCSKANIVYLDMVDPLLDAQSAGQQVIFDDSHLTPIGHRLMAEALTEVL